MLVNMDNDTRKLCVIGDPVGHSKSPLIQNTMLSALGLNYVYLAQYVPRGGAAEFLAAAKTLGYAGFNATMPHKLDLVPQMDELDEDAVLFGAVNTVCLREGRALGYNTDGVGFVRSLEEAGRTPAGLRAVVLGAGGAALAVSRKLCQQGAARVTVCNRTVDKASALCAGAPEVMVPTGFSPEELAAACREADLVVNCTSLGMTGVDADFADLRFLDAVPAGALVYDCIYSPAETALLRHARGRGLATANGLGMLIHQAIAALEHFVDQPLDYRAMAQLLRKTI